MTKSTTTREESIQAVFDLKVGYRLGFADIEILKRVARMALAAMDSESGCLPLDYLHGHKDGLEWASQLAEANHPETGDWLYDDPIELAKAIRKGPDMPPSQPALDTKPVAYTDERNLGYIDRGRETAYLWGKQNSEASDVALYRHAQPAPVVPEEMTPEMMRSVQLNSELGAYAASNLSGAYDLFAEFWKEACRAAMLAAAPHDTPALNSVQSVVTVPGKLIPVSEQKPDCWCLTCRPVTLNDMRFVVCPDCGNKRCPRANDHRDACTGSNEPGQEGSVYPAAQQEVKGE